MITCFQAEHRSPLNRSGLRQLRKGGRLPSIVFGKHMDATMVHISTKEFQQWSKQGNSGVVELDLEGNQKIPVLLEDVQRDPVTRDLLHVDFLHVKMDEMVRTKISIEYVGVAAGVKLGGVMQVQGTFINVEGLPGHMPAFITADISHLAVGETFLVEHLEIPEGVHVISPAEELLVSIVTPRVEPVAEDAS